MLLGMREITKGVNDASVHLVDGRVAVDALQQALLGVVLYHGRQLLVEDIQPSSSGLELIVDSALTSPRSTSRSSNTSSGTSRNTAARICAPGSASEPGSPCPRRDHQTAVLDLRKAPRGPQLLPLAMVGVWPVSR